MKNKYNSLGMLLRFGSKKIALLLFFLFFTILSTKAQVSVTATGGTLSQGYTTLKGAFDAVNAGTHTGVITINITANTAETAPCVLNSSGAGTASYTSVLIQPTVDGVSISGATATGRGLIELNGADNVTINGDNPNTTGTNRNLTISNTAANTVTYTSVIRIALSTLVTSADNDSVRNCIINGSAGGAITSANTSATTGGVGSSHGILVSGGASTVANTTAPSAIASNTTTTGTTTTALNFTVNNNEVTACGKGIYITGNATTVIPVLTITNNLIGNPTAGATTGVAWRGIGAQGFGAGSVISGNTIYIESWITTNSYIAAIDLGAVSATGTGAIIEKNTIARVFQNNTGGYGDYGINLVAGNGNIVRNNILYNLKNIGSLSFSPTYAGSIRIGAGNNHQIYHNTVSMTGSDSGTGNLQACLAIVGTGTTGIDIRNNIFSNKMTSSSTSSAFVCLYLPSGGTSAMNLTLNNNAYYTGTTAGLNAIAQVGTTYGTGVYTVANFNPALTTPATNLRSYTSPLSAAATNDNASFGSTNSAPFISSTNLLLDTSNAATQSDLFNKGAAAVLAFVNTDIQGEARPQGAATNPTIGADEVFYAGCAGATAGTITPSSASRCFGLTYTMNGAGTSTGAGISYQWKVATSSGGTLSNVTGGSGATTATYITDASLAPGTYYFKLETTCSTGPVSVLSNEFVLTVNALPTVAVTPTAGNYCTLTPAPISLTASGASTYTWAGTGTPGLSATTGTSITSTPSTSTVITVTGTDENSCVNTATATITYASSAPTVTVSPTSVSVCTGASTTLTANAVDTTLQGILNSINANSAKLIASVPTPSGFTDGITGNSIADGCNDMFDTGNLLNTNLATSIAYSNNAVTNNAAAFGSGGKYFTNLIGTNTCNTTSATIFYWAADVNGLTNVSITGNLGADGSGSQDLNTFTVSSGGVTYKCFFKRVYGATDPSVNHIFMIPQPNSATQSMGSTTDDDLHQISNLTGVTRIYYMLFAGAAAAQISVASATDIAQTFANTITPNITYNWSTGATSQAITVSPTSDTTYTVTGTIGCPSAPASATVTVGATLVGQPATNSATLCAGSNFTVTANHTGGGAPFNYSWSDGVTATVYPNAKTITANLPAGTYNFTATITDSCSGTTTSSVTVVVNALPVVAITPTPANAKICGTGTVSMTATGASTYVWTPTTALAPAAGTSATEVSSATVTTAYSVVGTDANGCVSAAANQTVTVGPGVTVGTVSAASSTVCLGGTTVLNSSPGYTSSAYCVPVYSNNDGTDGMTNVSLKNAAGTTTLYSRNSGLIALPGYDDQTALTTTTLTAGTSYQISVTINTSAGNVAAFMDFNHDGDFADSGETILPSTAVASSASTSLTFAVPAGALNGNTRLRVVERFSAAAAACNTTGFGETEDYNVAIAGGVDGVTIAWTPAAGLTPSAAVANPTTPALTDPSTTFTVTATDPASGCFATGSVTVTTTTAGPQITTPPASQTKCIAGTATFTVVATGSNMTYQWRKGTTNLVNGGSIAGATTATLTITGLVAGDAGDYNVVISSDCGSPATSADATLTIVTPLAGINASATTICSGQSVTLTENGGTATSWSWAPGGATTNAITVSPTNTTNYVVTATTQVAGCTATANVTVNVNQTPSAVTVTPNNTTVCNGNVVMLTSTGGTVSTNGTVGSATTLTGATSQPTAFCNRYEHYWMQTVFTAAELHAAGVQAGNINGIAFNIDAQGSATNVTDFKIRMGAAPAATLSAFQTTGLTQVYATSTYNINLGVNTISFNTPYAWDGTSNIILDVRQTGIDSINNATTYYTATTGSNTVITAITSTTYASSDDFVASNPTGTTSVNRLNTTFNYTSPVTNTWTTSPASTLYTDAGATAGNEYVPGTSASVVYARPTVATTYTVTAANGSCTSQGSATVNVNPLPVITLANSVTVCKGTGTDITIPENNNSYAWSPSADVTVVDAQTVHVNPAVTTLYTVTTTNTTTFCQSTNQITVNVNDPGAIITQPVDRIVAQGFSTSFTVAGTNGITYTYQWQRKTGPSTYVNLSNDSNYSGVNSAVLTVSNAGTGSALDNTFYRVLLTPPAPCSVLTSNDAKLTVSNTGIASSPSNVDICLPTPSTAQFSITTNGNEPYLVEWQVSTDNGATYNTISLIDVDDTFLYIGPNTTAVPGLTFSHPLDASNDTGANFKILDVSGISSVMTLKFKAIVNEALPSAVATLTVTAPASITTDLSTTAVVRCKTPASTTATNLSITTAGNVSSVQWRYDTNPGGSFASVVTNNTPLGASYVTSSAANNYLLDITTNGSTPAGNYYYKAFVNGTAVCGSTPIQSSMATITVASPAVTAVASSASYCSPGSPVALTAGGASTYSWTSVPAGFTSSSANASVTPTVATAYTVVGTDSNGCTNTASVNVGVGTSFTLAASAAASTVCPNASVALSAVPTRADGPTYLINTIPYQFAAVSGSFTPLVGGTSTGVAATADGAMSATITPGMSFTYGGTAYTSFRVSSDGFLVFGGAGTTTLTNNLATTTSTQRPGLAPLWDDLQCTSGITYQLSGTAPNRVLTVEWLNMEWNWSANAPVISFQVKLYETTNVVEFVYRGESTAVNNASSGASIGLMGTASTNYISLQDSSANPAISTSTSTNSIGTKPATGQVYRFTPVAPITYSYAWTSTPAGFNSTSATPTANPAVDTAYNVTATSNQGCTASASTSVTVNSAPPTYTTTTPASQTICSGSNVTFAVSATSASPLTYQWKKNGVNIPSATSATLTGTTTTAASTASNFTSGTYTVDIIGCTTITASFTLTVTPLPTATVAGTAVVCQNTASPTVTFTGATGTAPYTFTYTVTGTAGNQTLTTTSGNSATVSAPTNAFGAFTYTLVSVQDANGCSQTQTGSATVTVNQLPTGVTATANPTSVCSGGTVNLTSAYNASSVSSPGMNAFIPTRTTGAAFTSIIPATTITSWRNAASTDDNLSDNQPIGFSFIYNGNAYTDFRVSTNGFITFNTTSTAIGSGSGAYGWSNGWTVSSSGLMVAPNWDDLQTAGNLGTLADLDNSINYTTTGATGSRVLTVEWKNMQDFSTTSTANYNMQVKLYEADNHIEFVYGTMTQSAASVSYSLGLSGATVSTTPLAAELLSQTTQNTGTFGFTNQNSLTPVPASNTKITFATPPPTYSWTGPNGFTSSLANPTVPSVTTSGAFVVTVTNPATGCSSTGSANVTVTAQPQWYLDADADGYYTGTAVTSCTSPGAGYTMTVIGGGDCNDSVAGINPGATEICYNNIDDNCNGLKSEGCAPVVVNMNPSYNNTTMTSLANAVPAMPYTYGSFTDLQYRFLITDITTPGHPSVEIVQASRFVVVPTSLQKYNVQYTFTASAVINGEVVPYAGNTITVNAPVVQPVTLNSASCGSTLASLSSTITANPGLNATGYTFRIRLNDANPSPTYAYSSSSTRFISANTFSGFPLQYSSSYKIAVSYTFVDPVTNLTVESGYGAECTVNTPGIPVISMAAPTCGSTVTSLTASMSSQVGSYATGYQFRIRLFADNGPNPTYYTTPVLTSRFSSIGAFQGITLQYNTEYSISVQYSIANGTGTLWSGYGPDCKITTPFFPTTSLVASQCGLAAATPLNQQLNITPYPGFPHYKVLLEETVVGQETPVYVGEKEILYPYFKLSDIPGAQLGKTYNISVSIKLNGVFGPYSSACDVHTPAPAKGDIAIPFKATAYPNPFANSFMLDVKSSSQSSVNLKVYDMVGRLIEQRDVRISDMATTSIGDKYPSGVYNIVVSQEDTVQTVRVVKR